MEAVVFSNSERKSSMREIFSAKDSSSFIKDSSIFAYREDREEICDSKFCEKPWNSSFSALFMLSSLSSI